MKKLPDNWREMSDEEVTQIIYDDLVEERGEGDVITNALDAEIILKILKAADESV